VPTMFVELGSSPPQWCDQKAAAVVAQAAIDAIANSEGTQQTAAIGIGGTHYNQKFTNLALKNEASFSHMIPKYAIQHVDAALLRQCIERTREKVTTAILDWKGIKSEDKPALLSALQETALRIQKV